MFSVLKMKCIGSNKLYFIDKSGYDVTLIVLQQSSDNKLFVYPKFYNKEVMEDIYNNMTQFVIADFGTFNDEYTIAKVIKAINNYR